MHRRFASRSRSARPLLALALATTIVVASAAPAYGFIFRVRGYGHGLGMSQYGAQGFALNGFAYDHILRYYYGNAGTNPYTQVSALTSEPVRDVLLDKSADVRQGGNGGYTLATWTILPGHAGTSLAVYQNPSIEYFADGPTTFTAAGSSITVRDSAGKTRTYNGTVAVWGSGAQPVLTQVKEATGHYSHTDVRFRGELRLTAQSGKIKLVNRLSMRDYLYGVVPRESPSWFEMEALKAQAVAARGYSLTSTNTELYTDTRDQVYGGHSRGADRTRTTPHETARTNQAVDATFGKVVTYNSIPVRTYFMSTSGGHTEHSENVWGGTLPYIRGVPDPYEVYSGSTHHTWKEYAYDAATVRARLAAQGVSGLPATIAGLRVIERAVSGRVMAVEIRGADGSLVTYRGSTNMDRFRAALGNGYDRWWYVDPKTGARITGPDRFATSVAVSTRVFPSANRVIIAGGGAPADALAASGLAGAAGGAPILLTDKAALSPVVADEIRRLAPSQVYVIGGTGAVSNAVIDDLRKLPGLSGPTAVKRIGGASRYDTARLIAEEIKWWVGPSERAIIANGQTLVDAVAAAGLAYNKKLPVVLVRPTVVPPESAAALTSSGVRTSLVIGGPGVVSDEVMSRLPGATRIAAGADRYDTAAKLAEYIVQNEGFNWGSVYVSSGANIVDALSAGPVAGHNRNPMLFVKPYEATAPTYDALLARRASVFRVHIVGGEAAVPGWQQGQLDALFE